jgi:hypothetical protein
MAGRSPSGPPQLLPTCRTARGGTTQERLAVAAGSPPAAPSQRFSTCSTGRGLAVAGRHPRGLDPGRPPPRRPPPPAIPCGCRGSLSSQILAVGVHLDHARRLSTRRPASIPGQCPRVCTMCTSVRFPRLEPKPNRRNRNRTVLSSVLTFWEPKFQENRRTEPIGSVRTECPA